MYNGFDKRANLTDYKFVLANDVPMPFKAYKGIPLVYNSDAPKGNIYLMTEPITDEA